MKIIYDKLYDLAYIHLTEETRRKGLVRQSLRITDDMIVDLDVNGKIVGIELLKATARLTSQQIDQALHETLPEDG